MIKHKWIGGITALLMAVVVLFTGFALLNPNAFASISGTAEPAYVTQIDKTKIMSIQIVADATQWADMLENATAEEYIPATIIINGTKIENVGIRPKGNSSLSMVAQDETTDRFSFKIEFDHYISGQTWLGLDKIVVNNMQGDSTYMKEYLSYDIMNYVGVDAPLYAFADISVNGKKWGFYLAVEALDDSYAERVYGNDHGELYKPESMGMRGEGRMNEFIQNNENAGGNEEQLQGELPQQGQGQMPPQGELPQQMQGQLLVQGERNAENNNGGGFGGGMAGMTSGGVSLQYTDNESSNYSAIFDNSVFNTTENDYKRVIEALEKLSNGEDLESTVDVEAVLKYFAAHTVVVNLDSYISNMGHNYYLYEDKGQLTILPWDYNLAFGGFQSGSASEVVNFPIDTPVSGVSLEERPLLGKLLIVPEYKEMYLSYLQNIVNGYFNSGVFEQTIDSLNELITEHVESDPTTFYNFKDYQNGVAELKKLGLLRAESIEGQLSGAIPSTTEAQNANPELLVDATNVNLSVLGSQGGVGGGMGGWGNIGEQQGGMQGFDREVMQQALEILKTGENELTEEQLSNLHELGLTDEQITQFKSMAQGGFGNRNNGDGFSGQHPKDIEGATNNAPTSVNQQSVIVAGFDANTWAFIGGCIILFLAGLVFVILFKRRRST